MKISLFSFPQKREIKNFAVLFFFFGFLLQPGILLSQGYVQKTYINTPVNNYISREAVPDHNGGTLIIGLQSLVTSTAQKFTLDYVDKNGNLQWSLALPDLFYEGQAICAQNGDFLFTSLTTTLGTPPSTIFDNNIFLTRISPSGQVLWSHAYGNQYNEVPSGIVELPNGEIEILGYTDNYTSGTYNSPCRLRVSATGVLLQTDLMVVAPVGTIYEHMFRDSVTGNYILWRAGLIALADNNFQITWIKTLTCPAFGSVHINAVKVAPSGVIVCVGDLSGQDQGVFFTMDMTGTLLAQARYVKGSQCVINDVVILPSGRIACAVTSNGISPYVYNGQYQLKGFVFTSDMSGNVHKAVSFSQELSSGADCINRLDDSTLVINGVYGVRTIDDGCFYIRTDTSLWSPQICSSLISFADSSVTLVVATQSPAITYVQDALADSTVSPVIVPLQPEEIALCPTKTILRAHGNNITQHITNVHDGNVVVCSYQPLSALPYITKYNPEGRTIWSYQTGYYATQGLGRMPYSITETQDHGFLMGGGGDPGSGGGGNFYLQRFDSLGNPIWIRAMYNDSNSLQTCYLYRVKENADKSIIAMAAINVMAHTAYSRFALVKYDSLGNFKWAKSYENSYGESGDVISVPGGYIICGSDDYKSKVIKCDTAGNVIWSKEIGSNFALHLYALIPAANNEFIAAGQIRDVVTQPPVPVVIRFDANGNIIWSKYLSATANQLSQVRSITSLAGDNFLLSIHASDGSTSNYKGFLTKMQGNGTLQWTRLLNYDTAGGLLLRNTVLLADSTIIAAAGNMSTVSYRRFLKLSPGGVGPCNSSAYSASAAPATTVTSTTLNLTAINLIMFDDSGPIVINPDTAFDFFTCSVADTTFYSTNNPVGIVEMPVTQSNTNLILFPNPATNTIHIRSKQSGMKRIDMFSNTGQLVISLENKSSELDTEINLEGLPAGCYFVRVIMEDNTVDNLRCVKLE